MISDSYLMTHLGQSATALETASAQAEFIETLKDLTKEALSASMHELMRQAITLEYPRSPISKLNQTDLRRVICTDPWRDSPQKLRNDLHAA